MAEEKVPERAPRLGSNAREMEAVDELLVEVGFSQRGVVRPETKALVVARNCDDTTVAQHFNDAEIIDNAVVIVLTARCGGCRMPQRSAALTSLPDGK